MVIEKYHRLKIDNAVLRRLQPYASQKLSQWYHGVADKANTSLPSQPAVFENSKAEIKEQHARVQVQARLHKDTSQPEVAPVSPLKEKWKTRRSVIKLIAKHYRVRQILSIEDAEDPEIEYQEQIVESFRDLEF